MTTSAYPKSVTSLVEQVRGVADRDGVVPSRNRIMAEFHVGARRANQVLAELAADRLIAPGRHAG